MYMKPYQPGREFVNGYIIYNICPSFAGLTVIADSGIVNTWNGYSVQQFSQLFSLFSIKNTTHLLQKLCLKNTPLSLLFSIGLFGDYQ